MLYDNSFYNSHITSGNEFVCFFFYRNTMSNVKENRGNENESHRNENIKVGEWREKIG